MRVDLFKYKLHDELVAKLPPKIRSDAKLMVVNRKKGTIEHRMFTDIIDYINAGDVLVVNDAYMSNNSIYAYKKMSPCIAKANLSDDSDEDDCDENSSEVDVIVNLIKEVDPVNHVWNIDADPARKVRVGNKIYFRDFDMVGEVIENAPVKGRMMKLITNKTGDQIREELIHKGFTSVPKYLGNCPNNLSKDYLKGFFSKKPGSYNHVISSLHFDEKLVLKLEIKGVLIETLTYFLNNIQMNKFDTKTVNNTKKTPEFFNISEKTIDTVTKRKNAGSKIFAVGYSTIMGLENAYNVALNSFTAGDKMVVKSSFSESDFNICDGYLTNFYEPSSMFLIVDSAFCGIDLLYKVYTEAIKHKYKFLIFGDSLLII